MEETVALSGDHLAHPQRPEPGPGRKGGGRGVGTGEQVAERLLPARAQRRDPRGHAQPGEVPAGQVEQRVGLGHAQRAGTGPGLDDPVAGPDAPLAQDPHVKAGTVVGHQQRGQLRFAQAQTDPVAGDPGLGDLELGRADAVPVADADFIVRQPVDGQVFPERPVAQVVAAEVLLPVTVGPGLVDQHGALLAAVAGQVALPVAVDVEAADHRRAVHRVFPHAGVDGLPLPGHVLGQADVHRQQHGRDRHACPREAISSGVSSRSTPCGITLCPGSSRSRVPSRCTSTLSGSKEIRPQTRRTSVQASS